MNCRYFKPGSTECMTISTTEYIYPNTCNNITCSYGTAIDRVTTYTVTDTNGPLLQNTITQQISTKKCLLGSIHACGVIGICWCDPDGWSTSMCYNHTSGGEGQLTLKCTTHVQNVEKLATIAAIPSDVHPNRMIYSVNEGRRFGPLICNASCGPPCTFRWVGPTSIINSSELFINSASRTDNGTYICEATNTIGTTVANITIIIHYGPDKVILSPNKTSFVLNEGSDVPSIECKADCQPGCSLTWIKPNGQEELTNVLILNNIKRNQTGTYTCNASNVIGNMVSAGVTINLIGMY
ncbi:unnamed protein product [Mytilus edulis]|uniref:Ig-like domain-containing protein n=1 Tax=Mytilus edulis TaxID=6550 RepID=A0A8S3UBI5_MYTED|nr:unnamed protein product [Mytilus edulis]